LPAAARTLVSRTPLLYDVRRSYVALRAHALIANPNNKHEALQKPSQDKPFPEGSVAPYFSRAWRKCQSVTVPPRILRKLRERLPSSHSL
jgi:hypothetical protein